VSPSSITNGSRSAPGDAAAARSRRFPVVLAQGSLASVLFVTYLATLARGITFSDGGEIATAIASLGVMHPTGYPIFTVLGHYFVELLPTPYEVSFEIEILNALFGVGAALWVSAAVRRLCSLFAARSGASAEFWPFACWAGAIAGFALGITPLLWHQVRIPEVYPFHVFLTAWALYRIVVFEETRREVDIVWAVLPMGLGLAHHVTMAYLLPPAGLYFLIRKPLFFASWLVCPVAWAARRFAGRSDRGQRMPAGKWWAFPLACLVGSLPLASYGYLIWANTATTGITWGDLRDWQAVLEHASGRQYRHLMAGFGYKELGIRIDQLPGQLLDEMLLPGGILLLAGLWVCLRRAPLLLIVFVGLAASTLGHGLQYAVPDYRNYFLPAWTVSYMLLGIGLGAVGQALVPLWSNRTHWQRGRTLAVLVFAFVTATTAFAGAERIPVVISQMGVGAQHAGSIAREVPAGAIYLTDGDFLFPQWYYQHARHEGDDFAVIYIRALRQDWYVSRYLSSHYHRQCDPLWGPYAGDPEAYAEICETFEDRARIERPSSWVKVSGAAYRTGKLEGEALNALRAAQREVDAELMQVIVRGGNEKCRNADYRRTHRRGPCYCWDYFDRGYEVDEHCVVTPDEGGIVPMRFGMINAHRIIDDHIDERPIYERDVYTSWLPKGEKNFRKWTGPSALRVSGDFALINRGRSNQVVYSRDIDGFDPCARDELEKVTVPELREPRTRVRQPAERRGYRPNFHTTLLVASYLAREPEAPWYEASRGFAPGETAYLSFEWFERFRYDRSKRSNRGDRFHHGVRACVFDPEGQRIWQGELASGLDSTGRLEIRLSEDLSEGGYWVQACTVGEVASKTADFGDAACIRPILEYEFTLRTSPDDAD